MSAPHPENSDEILARLLEDLLLAQRQGSHPDLTPWLAEYPALASELRQLWATANMAEELAIGLTDSHSDLLCAPSGRDDSRALFPAQGDPQPWGDYELLEELGRGGMGVVYRARHVKLGRVVALKKILRADVASPRDLLRFRAEAEATAKLDHPWIVPVYEVGDVSGQPFFTMKLIEGTTLAKRLAEGPLPARDAAELLIPVCRAIAAAHRQGILHRDLKPANILLDRDGRPHVTDFGLAKRITSSESLTRTGAILGTPSFMPPEQAAGRRGELGPPSDVYSLGAILYQMLTGRPPFQAASPIDTLLLVLEQDPPPPRLLNPKADAELELICLKCLQKPPELRYETPEDLASDLERFLADEPIHARSSSLTQVVVRALRETHHAVILENWGLLWMWHSLVLLVICFSSNYLRHLGVTNRWSYLLLWSLGTCTWAVIFWELRRRAGPITFVERQIAHLWAGSVISSILLYMVEWCLQLPVLTLSPVLGCTSGMVFLAKAGILSGRFYFQAAALFTCSLAMALWPAYGLSVFGIVSALCFFIPGWKYFVLREQARAMAADEPGLSWDALAVEPTRARVEPAGAGVSPTEALPATAHQARTAHEAGTSDE